MISEHEIWQGIGLLGIAAFGIRFGVQWIVSEIKGESVVPRSFWLFSIAGALLQFSYAFYEMAWPFIVLHAINFGIYVRNLALHDATAKQGLSRRLIVTVVAMAALIVIAASFGKVGKGEATGLWLVCGFIGQLIWNFRFILQWSSSEKRGESVIPTSFWWVSLAGCGFLLAYSIHLRNPVFIIGYVFNPIVYGRNLVLIHRKRRAEAAEVTAEEGAA